MQGTKANKTGNSLESQIDSCLINNGYIKVSKNKFEFFCTQRRKVFARQFYIGESIYGTKQYCDFIIYDPQKYPDKLIIEAKWQQSPGSVDEKFPYLVHNINNRRPLTIIVLDGGGYKQGAENWLKQEVRSQVKKASKLYKIFNLSEFITFANNGEL